MSLDSPVSYAEWYWKHSMDATGEVSKLAESTYAPVISQFMTDSGFSEFIPEPLKPLFGILTAPTEDFWDDIQRPFLNTLTRITSMAFGEEIARPGIYAMKAGTPTLKIDADIAALLTQRKKMSNTLYKVYGNFAGYDTSEGEQFYKSRIPYPSIPDIITASRYLGDVTNPKPYAMSKFDIPDEDWMVWDWLTYQKLTTEQVLELYRTGFWDEQPVDTELARLGWRLDDIRALHNIAYELPNAMLLVQSGLVQGLDDDTVIKNISKGGIHPVYAEDYYNAVLTKPASIDVVSYELRRDPSLANLSSELRKIGIHHNYHGLYKELAYQIPPVADIITMAVREAFTPEIAVRFGQYQDLPPEFVEWVGKKGLSKEWAERYWAAHWSLPSPQQGFEMLHRGIIGRDDLYMLMRALDIMPYWRDKLIEMAYRPLTRVDVRRMFGLGTLDESGIMKAYRDLGYNEYNAAKMTDFTVRWTRQTQSRFSSGDVVTAYTNYLISSGEARSKLTEIGIRDEEISNIIKKAGYKRTWATKQETIDAIKNLYKKGTYDESETRSRLSKLALPDDYIDTQIQQWQSKAEADIIATWTAAQTLSFFKKKLISQERAEQEFKTLGYDEEHIKVYVASAIPAP